MIEIRNISDEPIMVMIREDSHVIDPGKSLEILGYEPDGVCEMLTWSPSFTPSQPRRIVEGVRPDGEPKSMIR